MKGLKAWEWPGNIRELENFTERAVILTRGKSLEAPLSELRRPIADTPTATAAHPAGDDIARIVKETISALNGKKDRADEFARKQREEIVRALTESKGRVGGADGAAARMGINRTTLLARMKKFGIRPPTVCLKPPASSRSDCAAPNDPLMSAPSNPLPKPSP